MSALRRVAAALGVMALAGCGKYERLPWTRSPYSVINGDPTNINVPWSGIDQKSWTAARSLLATMRESVPTQPYVARLRIAVTDPRNGKKIGARGALAVNPGTAARLVLVGPGGSTAVDVWVTPDRYRLAIPALKVEKRGGKDLEGTYGLPIGFLRWWFLAPLDGELLTVEWPPTEDYPMRMILGSRGATYEIVRYPTPKAFLIGRRDHGGLEWIRWGASDFAPAAGRMARYVDDEHHVDIEVTVEAVMTEPPDPEVFADPDREGQAL